MLVVQHRLQGRAEALPDVPEEAMTALSKERIAELRAIVDAAAAAAVPGGDYIGAMLHAAPKLLDMAEEALNSRKRIALLTGFVQNGPGAMEGPCILGCAGTHVDVHADDCLFAAALKGPRL